MKNNLISLEQKDPELYNQIHFKMNAEKDISVESLSYGSAKVIWWQCKKVDWHYWSASVNSRFNTGAGCAMCANRYIVHGLNDLSITKPELYNELNFEKNALRGIDVYTLSPNSHTDVYWKCLNNEKHSWKVSVVDRYRKSKCPDCNRRKTLAPLDFLNTYVQDLYEEIDFAKNLEEGINLDNLPQGKDSSIWWKCKKDNRHSWNVSINSRNKKIPTQCPMCLNRLIVHGINDLSYYRPEIYKNLHLERNLEDCIDIKTLAVRTNKKVWWQCEKNTEHIWKAALSSRTGLGKHGCPHCVYYKNESEFRELFTETTSLAFVKASVYGKRKLFERATIQVDMLSLEKKVVIEYDGHFSHGGNVLYKSTEEEEFARDEDTTKVLLEQGYKVIRIRESPLKHLAMQSNELFQVSFMANSKKLIVVENCMKALQKMGVDIELKERLVTNDI